MVEIAKVIVPPAKVRVHDRIMQIAGDLFYRRGIRAVGVDMIASEAGTNKMSFYRCFESKDDLIVEYLSDHAKNALVWWDTTVASHAGDPGAQIQALFDAQLERATDADSRGCALANAAVEITEPAHPARVVVENFKAELRRRFRALAHSTGAHDPDALGDSLMLLWEGACATTLTFGTSPGPAETAAKAAQSLVSAFAR